MAGAKRSLAELKAKAAVPGACDRAARIIVDRLRERTGDVRRAA
jgi:hypothetical protein